MIPKVNSDDQLKARITLDSLAQEIRKGAISFEDAAKRYSSSQAVQVLNPATGSARFDKETFNQLYPGVGIVAMEEGEVSNAVSHVNAENKTVYSIIQLTKRIPEHKANLTDDYDRIYEAALQTAKTKKIIDWCNRMVRTTYIYTSDEYKDCPNFSVNWTPTL